MAAFLMAITMKFRRWNGNTDSVDLMKPYCVACQQAVIGVVYGGVVVASVLNALVRNGSWMLSVICIACIVVGCMVRRFRRVTFGREMSTLVFLLLSAFSIYRIYISDEPWDTTPHCEDDVPVWIGGERKDPGGEKVAYSMLFALFVAVAAMPWLPAGNRYYRDRAARRRG